MELPPKEATKWHVTTKYKSRICINGKEQEFGLDYWETYAPVASWTTIRLLMLLSSIMDLKIRQVDYTQAFLQVKLTDSVFMQVPQGWYINTNGLLAQHDAQNWYKHLTAGLLTEGFTQSPTDRCLFFRNDSVRIHMYFDVCRTVAQLSLSLFTEI